MSQPADSNQTGAVPPGPLLSQINAGQAPPLASAQTDTPVTEPPPLPIPIAATTPTSVDQVSEIQIPSQEPTPIEHSQEASSPDGAVVISPGSTGLPNDSSVLAASESDTGVIDIPIQFVGSIPDDQSSADTSGSITPSSLPSEAPVVPIQSPVNTVPAPAVVSPPRVTPAPAVTSVTPVSPQTNQSDAAQGAVTENPVSTVEPAQLASETPTGQPTGHSTPGVLPDSTEARPGDSPVAIDAVAAQVEPKQAVVTSAEEIVEQPPASDQDTAQSVESAPDSSKDSTQPTVDTSVTTVQPSTDSQDTTASPSKPSQGPKAPTNLLDILVEQGQLTQDQANEVLTQNIQTGLNVEHLLEKNKLVSEDVLAQARSVYYNIPYVNLNEVGIYPEALAQVPEGVARSYWMLPFALNKEKNQLMVAMRNPLDVQAVDFVEHKTGNKVVAHYAAPSEIERHIAEQYSQSLSTEVTQALEQTKQVQQQKQAQQDFGNLSGGMIRQAPITKIVQTILSFSLKARASDVHIEPQETRTRVRYRIDGILQEKLILPKSVHQAVVSRIKILAGLKIDERRLPQDGRFDFSEGSEQVDLRISTLPTIHGEKVVMRLLKKNAEVPTLEELGLTGLALRNVQDAIKVPHGIILVTGPTGSGKTTTLYSVLHTINTPKVNIMTLEDPVEYQMPGVNQVQVNPQAGLTFASGLRSFLRQDPNIIMVGEIRDSETAGLAVQASLTGHLVFSTLHTSSSAGALPRLMDMGAEPFLLASSMTCVLAQRIVRIINPEYKEPYRPDPAVLQDIKTVLGDQFTRWLQQNQKTEKDIMLMKPKKDRPEVEPEYKGRIAIFEVMPITEEVGRLIMSRKAASEMEKVAIKNGMLLMKQDGYLKVLDGITTIEEVLRVAEI